MPPESTPPPRPGDLQFDHVVAPGSGAGAPTGSPGALKCANCGASIETQYYHLGEQTICEACKRTLDAQIAGVMAKGKGAGAMTRAFFLGLGAAVLGAAIYYGVIAITNLEIGIVAILIGYMVGWAVRKGSSGVGGRRFQVLAVALTYFSVGLAYSPLLFQEMLKEKRGDAVSIGAVPDSAKSPSVSNGRAIGLALLAVLALVLALPVMAVIGSMPSGIISAIIIGVGLRQAWRMTAAAELVITGPYKVVPVRPAAG